MIAKQFFIGIRNEPKVKKRSETEMKEENLRKKLIALIESKSSQYGNVKSENTKQIRANSFN